MRTAMHAGKEKLVANPSTAPSSTWGSTADRQQWTQERQQELFAKSIFKMDMTLKELRAAINIDLLEQEIKYQPKRVAASRSPY